MRKISEYIVIITLISVAAGCLVALIILIGIEVKYGAKNSDKNNNCESNRILKCISKDNLYIQIDSINKYPIVECKCYLKD